ALRDIVYDYIAKNRYKWFGKKDACRIPDAETKSRFL
ncbi:MAG: thiol-disulfide oxidoreductase, partial [Ignavibacteria bacterium]